MGFSRLRKRFNRGNIMKNLFGRLVLFATLLPIIDFLFLGILTRYTSVPFTLLFIAGTALAGVWLIYIEGLRCIRTMREEIAARRAPTDAMLDGVLIVVAGVLLIIPGVLTDVLAVLLLLPPTRFLVRLWIKRRMKSRLVVYSNEEGTPNEPRSQIIDVRVTEVDPDKNDR